MRYRNPVERKQLSELNAESRKLRVEAEKRAKQAQASSLARPILNHLDALTASRVEPDIHVEVVQHIYWPISAVVPYERLVHSADNRTFKINEVIKGWTVRDAAYCDTGRDTGIKPCDVLVTESGSITTHSHGITDEHHNPAVISVERKDLSPIIKEVHSPQLRLASYPFSSFSPVSFEWEAIEEYLGKLTEDLELGNIDPSSFL